MGLVILGLVSLGTAGVINFATRQVQRSGEINELNTLIETDLAQVRSANDRLVCNDGTCSIAGSDPGEEDYFPAMADSTNVTGPEQANIDFFLNLCTYRDSAGNYDPGSGFAAQLDSLLPVDERLVDAGLERTMTYSNPSNPDLYAGHRYTVSYTRPEGDPTILRQVTLVPATVAWCPCVPSGTSATDLCP